MLNSVQKIAIIGAGPAGLMAAEMLLQAGFMVDLYDAMPSPGRKFLLAGKGGLNITHSEGEAAFIARYGNKQTIISRWLQEFSPVLLREWVHGLGVETFVGSSGKVFPKEMKAAPLLRAWLHRLRESGLKLHVRHRWQGWDESGALRFATPAGETLQQADACLLALGGGSWPHLGSDAAWVPVLQEKQIPVSPLLPANCGFNVAWSDFFRTRFAGQAVKTLILSYQDQSGCTVSRRGELVVSEYGIEGSLVYALAAGLRDRILDQGSLTIALDLLPDRSQDYVLEALSRPRGADSMANHLRRKLGIEGVKAGLLRECVSKEDFADPLKLAAAIKSLPLQLLSPRPLSEAISSAGGVMFEALDDHLMLLSLPGVFCAGEMLDWEAPTGGYLLTACLASGRVAAAGIRQWLRQSAETKPAR